MSGPWHEEATVFTDYDTAGDIMTNWEVDQIESGRNPDVFVLGEVYFERTPLNREWLQAIRPRESALTAPMHVTRVDLTPEQVEANRAYADYILGRTAQVFQLYEGFEADGGPAERRIGDFATFEAARDEAVPDHPDEWVRLDNGDWFHGGGNFPGQSFTIRRSGNAAIPDNAETGDKPNIVPTFGQVFPPKVCERHDPDIEYPDKTSGYIGDCRNCGAAVVRINFDLNEEAA